MMIEGCDYFIRVIDFPNWASPMCTVENEDGTYSVYLNGRYTREQWRNKFPHEQAHMENNHFQDERPIRELEAEADAAI